MSDFMPPESRRRIMSAIKSKNTKPEVLLGSMMHRAGLRYRKHAKDLPGRPDFVFRSLKIAVFVDGDFWHGYKLHEWEHKLSPGYWDKKIKGNVERDCVNREALRTAGWRVIRIWEHQLKNCPELMLKCVQRTVRKSKEKMGNHIGTGPPVKSEA